MNEEMLKRLAGGKSPEEVLTIAREYGKELTEEQAREIYDKLKARATGELSDDDVDAVAGGYTFEDIFGVDAATYYACENCHDPKKTAQTYTDYVGWRTYFHRYCDDCARLLGRL